MFGGFTPVFSVEGEGGAYLLHCTCLLVSVSLCSCPVLAPCSVSGPSLDAVDRECFQEARFISEAPKFKTGVLYLCPAPAFLLTLLTSGGWRGRGTAPGRDQQQAVSRLGLDVHSQFY